MSTALLKKKVVVIGYGFAGSKFTAQALKKHPDWEITVITPFDYQEVPLRMTESIAAGSAVHDKAIYPLLREPGVTYIIDVVETLTDGSLRTVSGVELTFDAAVLAVGQKIPFFYPDPRSESTAEARKASIRALNETIQVAKSIVVAGGGAVGTEVAADIKLRHPSTSVTVVSSQPDILSSMPPAFRTLAARQLTSEIGVTVKFNARVVSHDPKAHSVTLSSGEALPCDVFLAAHPEGGNAGFLPAGAKDTRNYAKVDDTFQVNGLRKVFAFGDGANYDVVKTVPRIDDQLPTVLHNVQLALTTSSTVVSLTHHKKGFMGTVEGPMLVAFGHHHEKGTGVGVSLPGCMGLCCFVCCCFGGPCQTPGGHGAAKMKSDFNDSISPKAGKGMDR